MMRVARAALSAFLSMALVVGMVPDCAYAKVAAQALRLGASQVAQGTAGDATELSIPEELGGSKVVGIAPSAFARCASLAFVELPGSVAFVGAHALEGCASLSPLGLSEGVRRLGARAFSGCPSLSFVELPASLESTEGGTP